MSDPGSNAHQSQGRYQSGVWLSKAEGVRSEKYQKWTDEYTKCKMETLDKQKHSSLVKLHSQQLEVRTELRGLQQHRRQLKRDRLGSGEGSDPLHRDPSKSLQRPASVSSEASRRRIQKVSSTGSLASASSTGHSSLGTSPPSSSSTSSPSSAFKRSSSSGREGVLGSKTAGMKVKGVEAKLLDPEVSATKLRNFHSSRALSKLKNNMDISN